MADILERPYKAEQYIRLPGSFNYRNEDTFDKKGETKKIAFQDPRHQNPRARSLIRRCWDNDPEEKFILQDLFD